MQVIPLDAIELFVVERGAGGRGKPRLGLLLRLLHASAQSEHADLVATEPRKPPPRA